MAKLAAGSKRKSHPPKAVPGYKTLGGHDPQTVAFRNILAAQGTNVSEALLLGLGGGLDFGYHVHETPKESHLLLGVRRGWEEHGPEYVEAIAKRIGAKLEVKETDNAKGASNLLVNAVRTKSRAALVWVDMASLDWHYLPKSLAGFVPHTVSVFGLDDDAGAALVDDAARGPFLLSVEELADARGAIADFNHRFLFVESVEKRDLADAVLSGIADTVAVLTKPEREGFGIAGIERWSELVLDNRSKGGWGKIFPGAELVTALTEAYTWLELQTGGGALRPLYAEFLREAASLLKKPALKKAAEQYDALGAQWSELGQALLPDPRFKWVREALVKKNRAIADKGQAGAADAEKITKEIASTSKTAAEKLTADERKALLENLSKKLAALAKDEAKAVRALKAAL